MSNKIQIDPGDTFLTPEEFAKLLHKAVQTLADWRCKRIGPPYVKVGRHVRYPRSTTLKWMESHAVIPQNPQVA